MPRLVGASRASWLILSGERIDAATALQWGLVNKVVPLDRLDAEIGRLAAGFLACGAQALRAQKALLRSWEELPLAQALRQSIESLGAAFTSGEPQQFMQAFLDRRRSQAWTRWCREPSFRPSPPQAEPGCGAGRIGL